MASSVMSLQDATPSTSILFKIICPHGTITHPNLDYGKKMEPIARLMYETEMANKHEHFTCEQTGLHVSKELPFIGASPDGIVSCECHGKRVLEIKCSIKHQHVSPSAIPNLDSRYPVREVDGRLCLKHNSRWYYQVQQQMGVTGIDMCDFVLHTKKGIEVIPVNFDKAVWDRLIAKSTRVFMERVVPAV